MQSFAQYTSKCLGVGLTNLWHAGPKFQAIYIVGTRHSLLSQFFSTTKLVVLEITYLYTHTSEDIQTV
jgi:hypothetical protein